MTVLPGMLDHSRYDPSLSSAYNCQLCIFKFRISKWFRYTNCKLTDMVLMYEKADGNGREAQRLYSEAFPESRV
jgi:hypothetical protein